MALSPDVVGWASTLVLMATLGWQVWVQWRERSTQGLSNGLFIGQIAASVGFIAYSAMVGNTVFIVTNSLLAAVALVGQFVVRRNLKLEKRRDDSSESSDEAMGTRRHQSRPAPILMAPADL